MKENYYLAKIRWITPTGTEEYKLVIADNRVAAKLAVERTMNKLPVEVTILETIIDLS